MLEKETDMGDKQPTDDPANMAKDKRGIWRQRAKSWGKDLLIVGLVYLGVSAWQQRDLLPTNEGPAPEFTLQTLEGESVPLSSLQGKSVQLHFWATWCGVCRQEFGTLNNLSAEMDDNSALVTVVINSGSVDKIRRFADENELNYPILIGNRAISDVYKVKSLPTNYYLNDAGEIVGRSVGYSPEWAMKARLWWANI